LAEATEKPVFQSVRFAGILGRENQAYQNPHFKTRKEMVWGVIYGLQREWDILQYLKTNKYEKK